MFGYIFYGYLAGRETEFQMTHPGEKHFPTH